MVNNPEKLNKPSQLFERDEAGQIQERLEEKNREDGSLSKLWKDPAEFKKAVKETLEELREESKEARKELD